MFRSAVEDDDRAAGRQIVEGQLPVEAVAGDHRARSARRPEPPPHPTADHVQKLPDRMAVGVFVDPRVEAVAADAEQLGAVAALRAHVVEPLRALVENARGMAEGLHIVDHGRIAEIAPIDREGRAGLRFARQPFAGTDQGAFLAADIGAGAHLDTDIEIEPADRRGSPFPGVRAGGALPARVPEGRAGRHIRRAGKGSLPSPRPRGRRLSCPRQQMRPLGQQNAVLEGAGFALIGIADDKAPLSAAQLPAKRHLRPVVNPAPPQPRKPLSSIIEIIWEEVMLTALERPASSGTGPRSTAPA
jgi:hypothetical protein